MKNISSHGTRRRFLCFPCFLCAISLLLLSIYACDKVPINGQLDGMWQILNIYTPDSTRTVKDSQAYLSFQLHLSQWDFNNQRCYAHFRREADSIFFFDFSRLSAHTTSADDDPAITDTEMANGLMDIYGFHTTNARFHINRLDHSRLVLQAQDTILTFRKF